MSITQGTIRRRAGEKLNISVLKDSEARRLSNSCRSKAIERINERIISAAKEGLYNVFFDLSEIDRKCFSYLCDSGYAVTMISRDFVLVEW